jgi:3-methyladenine DNA glycosylase AlkD
MKIESLKSELRTVADHHRALALQRYFKTGPGEYAEGDVFLGIRVPVLRRLAKKYVGLTLNDTVRLLRSRAHEERLTALLILIGKYRTTDMAGKKKIYDIYLNNTGYINNWDLVDVTAKHIVGDYLSDKSRSVLYDLARSPSLWERRISILSTARFIEHGDFADTLKISRMLIDDEHDLIHKAVGWMLREVGKHDIAVEEQFLKKHHRDMPRTALRYAIEKFPESRRKAMLDLPGNGRQK